MKNRSLFRSFFPIFFNIMKCLSYLLCFNPELFWISNRKPFTSTVYLKMSGKFLFEWGFLYGFHNLRLEVIRARFENSEIHSTPRNCSSGDDDFPSIWSDCKAFSSEYKFIDMDIFEDFVLFHEFLIGYKDYIEALIFSSLYEKEDSSF